MTTVLELEMEANSTYPFSAFEAREISKSIDSTSIQINSCSTCAPSPNTSKLNKLQKQVILLL